MRLYSSGPFLAHINMHIDYPSNSTECEEPWQRSLSEPTHWGWSRARWRETIQTSLVILTIRSLTSPFHKAHSYENTSFLSDDVITHQDRPSHRARSRVPLGTRTGNFPLCLHIHLHGTTGGSSHTRRRLMAEECTQMISGSVQPRVDICFTYHPFKPVHGFMGLAARMVADDSNSVHIISISNCLFCLANFGLMGASDQQKYRNPSFQQEKIRTNSCI